MNSIAKQLRENAQAVFVSVPPAAAIAGALEMAADEIDRLQKLLDATKPSQQDLQKQITV